MWNSPFYGEINDESEHLQFLNWLDEFCHDSTNAKLDEWFCSKNKDERALLLMDGYHERANRMNDGIM